MNDAQATKSNEEDYPLFKKLKTENPLYMTECTPVKTVNDLYTVVASPPGWTNDILVRVGRSPTAIQNVLVDCHTEVSHISRPRIDTKFIPKTLVCHDYKGGYHEDRFLTGVGKGNEYTFYNWAHIDIFVYFSHHFITIPPLCWINAAHSNGVKILGTMITEAADGKQICEQIFKDMSTMQYFSQSLAKLVNIFKLDGWLLNIENPISNPEVLLEFVPYLTDCVHQANSEALVIWYDSVTETGQLSWQNELNYKNLYFFDNCDGIFLNYVWTEQLLINSLERAKQRSLDVFVGIDVFGRNTFGGGQFDCYQAAEVIRKHNLSMAIFAPGWTHESIVESAQDKISLMEHFLNKDSALWNSLWPYLYTHPITKFFETSFFIGVDKNQFNMFNQQQQLSKIAHPKYSYLIPAYEKIPTLEKKCHCVRLEYENDKKSCFINTLGLVKSVPQNSNLVKPMDSGLIHNIFHCDIPADGQVLVYMVTKKQPACVAKLRMVTCLRNGARDVVLLKGKMEVEDDSSFTCINPEKSDSEIVTSLNKFYSGWLNNFDIKAYKFHIKSCNILEIGVILEEGDGVYLLAFGIRQA